MTVLGKMWRFSDIFTYLIDGDMTIHCQPIERLNPSTQPRPDHFVLDEKYRRWNSEKIIFGQHDRDPHYHWQPIGF